MSVIPTPMPSPSPAALGDISGSLLTYTLPDDYLQLNDVYDVDNFGPQLVYVDLYGEHGGIGKTVWLIDLATGQRIALNQPEASVGTLGPRISSDDVVWSADDPMADGRLRWRVMHYQISSGKTEVIYQGVNARKEDGSPSAPATALDAGLVAYTVESPTDAWPYGWKIDVRRLSDGSVEREIQTRYSVWDLTIQNGNVLYSEVAPEESGDNAAGLMLSTTAHPEPVQVADNGSDVAIDGQRLVWAGVANFAVNTPVMGQGVYTATFDDLTPIRLSQPTPSESGGRHPAAGNGLVTWMEPSPAWDNLYMWDSQTGRTYQIAGQHDSMAHRYATYLSNIAGGWLTWSVTLATDTEELSQFAGITTDDLRAAEPVP